MASLRDQLVVRRRGLKNKFLRELYFFVLKTSWTYFVIGFALTFVVINAVFAAFYMTDPGGVANIKDNSFFELFVFSSQTFSTVGYGYYLPTTAYSHFIAVIENMAGILFTAIMTGLTFAKFSRPTSSVIFTDKVLVANFDGVPTLMFRLGNGRDTSIVDARISVVTLRPQKTKEGLELQRFINLKLERDQSPFFLLTWTVMHKMDEQSPFYGYTEDDFRQKKPALFVSLNGFDETFSETIHTGWQYQPHQIHFGKKFADMVELQSDGSRILDFTKFNQLVD
jgi:inward rectifier potassium channel